MTLGAVMIAVGASPLQLPSGFLHWFVALGGVLLVIRGAWPWANDAMTAAARSPSGVTLGRAGAKWSGWLLLAGAVAMPFTPFADQKTMDLGVLILTYVMLGWGLNIVVGLAGLLDLGYVAFYAVGAYSYALLSTQHGMGFWAVLPLAGMMAALFGIVLGFPVLRLRGDYLAIVTLGFGEIIRLVLLNWFDLTNGPAGIGSIPGPTLFGAVFAETAPAGKQTVSEMLGIPFNGIHRLIFLYYIILFLALITNLFTQRMRRLPVGRAWEALREDETACRALGINPTNTKLTAFAIGAMFAGFAGSFFAAKQRFISPESFVFIESAIILAIVVLGGMGSQIGVVLAAVLLIGLPEWFRDLGSYRMLAFGLAMVLIMVFRPRGLHRPSRALAAAASGQTGRRRMNAPQSPPLIDVEHLTMRFGGLLAVDDVSFAARPREITAIIGPNGAGKTTVFNCITGFYKPTVGRLTLRGGDRDYLLERMLGHEVGQRAKVARTFQNIRLFPAMTVLENLMVAQHNKLMRASGWSVLGLLGLRRYRQAEEAGVELARGWLERIELLDDADRPAGELPYGAQRRLEIARAMCTEPRLLCLDEPAAGLNPRESAQLNQLLVSIRDRDGVGMLLIEHDMSVVMNISDHVIVLDYGRKIAEGNPAEVRAIPP